MADFRSKCICVLHFEDYVKDGFYCLNITESGDIDIYIKEEDTSFYSISVSISRYGHSTTFELKHDDIRMKRISKHYTKISFNYYDFYTRSLEYSKKIGLDSNFYTKIHNRL